MEKLLEKKTNEFNELQKELKILQNIHREQSKTIDNNEKTFLGAEEEIEIYFHKKVMLKENNDKLKLEIEKIKLNNQQNENKLKKLDQKLTFLQEKYPIKPENKIEYEKIKEFEKLKLEFSLYNTSHAVSQNTLEQKYQKILKNFSEIKKINSDLTNKLLELHKDKDHLKQVITEKKEKINKNASMTIESGSPNKTHTGQKSKKNLLQLKSRKVCESRYHSNEIIFSDKTNQDKKSHYHVIKLRLFIDKILEIIKGFQATYINLENNEEIDGLRNCLIFDEKQTEFKEIIFEKEDYLKFINGSFNQKGYICYLELISNKEKIFEIGKKNELSKNFELKIEKNEVPISLFGKYTKDENLGSLLSEIGAEVIIDEVLENIKWEYPINGGKLKRIN